LNLIDFYFFFAFNFSCTSTFIQYYIYIIEIELRGHAHSMNFIKGEGLIKNIRLWGGGLKSNVRILLLQEIGKTTGL